MALNDTLSNALSTIQNAERIGKESCAIKPISKVIKSVLEILNNEGFIGSFKEAVDGRGNFLVVNLLGNINKCNSIKPRYALKIGDYEKFEKRYLPAKDLGVMLVSTNKGILTHTEAKKKNLGGRLFAFCY